MEEEDKVKVVREGKVKVVGKVPKVVKVPARVNPFVGRRLDMMCLLEIIHKEGVQVVQVYGMIPGVGKSTLVRNITNHLYDRNLFKGGILYFNLDKVTSV
jgi:polynucleotide 5'-kinase involved in rRNA processing